MNSIPSKRCLVCDAEPQPFVANGLPLWKCPACLLMWRQSFNVPISHYEEAPGGFSKNKEILQRRNIRDRIRTIKNYVNLDYTCDVGGSKGYFVEGLMQSGYIGVYGLDPNRAQVDRAKRRGVPMIAGSTEDLQKIFIKEKTNNVSLFHVVEHLSDPTKTITEIYNALPQKGYLIIETPDFSSYSFRKLDYKHRLVYAEHLFYFNKDNLPQFLRKIGFNIKSVYKRDFDQYHLGVRESLFRLGIMQRGGGATYLQKIVFRLLDIFFTIPLALLVKLLGRGNFVLVIAQKL